jgi:peptide chain release factor 1
LWELEEMKAAATLGTARSVIGRGMRAEKIRTYNFPQNRVTDHRIGKSWHNLDDIIEGKMTKITDALLASTV